MDSRFIESGSTWYTSPIAGELTAVLKATPGKLFYLRISNLTAAARFIFLFDSASAAGALFGPPVRLAANEQVELKLVYPMQGAVGLTLSSSTTQNAYAAGGANDMQVHALFK
jgi:hypothetical protein